MFLQAMFDTPLPLNDLVVESISGLLTKCKAFRLRKGCFFKLHFSSSGESTEEARSGYSFRSYRSHLTDIL